MTNSNKQTGTEEVNIEMRRSFSWDRAFFTSDGFLAAEELSTMIEGGGDDEDDVKQELQKIEDLETMEAKLFQEIESSTLKSGNKRDSQAKKVTAAGGPHKDAPIKIAPGDSPRNNVKTPTRKSMSPKTGKTNANSPSKTPPGVTTKNKVASVKTRVSRTSPASPVSPGSPGSTSSSANQRSKRSGSVPGRSLVKNEKPSATDALKNNDWKSSKPAVTLMPKTQSTISLKIKPPPVISHPSSPSALFNSSSSSTTQSPSKSSSLSNCTVDQRSKSRGIKGSTVVQQTSKKTLKNHPTGQNSDPNGKHAAATGSTNASNAITVAAANTGSKPHSPKTATHKKQSKGIEHILIISPEVLDLKGKINALRMEIDMHKKERCNKRLNAENGEPNFKTPFAVEESSL
ncbi:hypothetical protein QVD17_36335 [Tagetes erecta]|uniref:Uncharacterized protein n=1 Tax=Tagetes erecta TaxID=13708 RepID=A0AAD8JUG4_TARER|nr:hypothetical protein QVD17_36335 [Tagetes erecta]